MSSVADEAQDDDKIFGHVRTYMPCFCAETKGRLDVHRRGYRSLIILTRSPEEGKNMDFFGSILR